MVGFGIVSGEITADWDGFMAGSWQMANGKWQMAKCRK
jgi:hypothetical protein